MCRKHFCLERFFSLFNKLYKKVIQRHLWATSMGFELQSSELEDGFRCDKVTRTEGPHSQLCPLFSWLSRLHADCILGQRTLVSWSLHLDAGMYFIYRIVFLLFLLHISSPSDQIPSTLCGLNISSNCFADYTTLRYFKNGRYMALCIAVSLDIINITFYTFTVRKNCGYLMNFTQFTC